MDSQPMTTERLPKVFVDLYCTQLAAWWGGSRQPFAVRLCWPADLGRVEVDRAAVKCIRQQVDGVERLAVVPASEDDADAISRNAIAWTPRPLVAEALKVSAEPARTIGANIA